MIVFFLVTAILNIALGYGLAIYLGHARKLSAAHVGDVLHADSLHPDALYVDSAEVPAVADAHAAAPEAASPIAAMLEAELASATEQAAPAEPDDATRLESDVLAGIEEFRNQLAKMKAQPVDGDPKPAKAPALT